MKSAKIVFNIAGVYGLLVVLPLYFMEARIGRNQPPAITHLEFYYGFVGVTVAWQVAFLIIGSDPVRFRPLMPAAMIEKFSYVIAGALLWSKGRIPAAPLPFVLIDLVFGLFFVMAYVKLRYAGERQHA